MTARCSGDFSLLRFLRYDS